MKPLVDGFGRTIDYLRISVTDRCNLRCLYCMPKAGILQKPPAEILTFEEIVEIVKLAVDLGIEKIKITGGEPLLRRNLPRLFSLLFSVSGLQDISLTTNGVLLARYAKELKETGLKMINISIDTLRQDKFERITRSGNALEQVLKGVEEAKSQGFLVKLNVVVLRGINFDEILDFVRFAQEKNVVLRFIELMPMAQGLKASRELFVSCDEIKENLELLGALSPINANLGSGPARYYKLEGASLIVGFISPISRKFCFDCNRLRLTADGLLMPCLNSKSALDVKSHLRRNKKEEEILALLKKAACLRPQGHNFTFASCGKSLMSQVGG
jgi:GTP 3',8-cyclase